MKRILIVMLMCLILPISAYSQTADQVNTDVQIDLMDLDDTTRNSVMRSIKKKKASLAEQAVDQINIQNLTVESAEKWRDIAMSMVEAIKALCAGLNVEVNEFAKTPVGILTIGVLIWKIAGAGALSYIINIVIWTVISTIIIGSFRYFHMAKKVKDVKEYVDPDTKKKVKDKTVRYVKRHKWEEFSGSGNYNALQVWSVIGHVAMFCAITLALLA